MATHSLDAAPDRTGLFSFPNPVNEVSARLVAAATLESVFGYCLGCKIFALLMKAGVVPEEVCERCSDIWADRPQAA